MYLLHLNQYLLQYHTRPLLLCLQLNQHLLLRLQLNEQTFAALPTANPNSTIAALPATLQLTSTALLAVTTVYKESFAP